MDGKSTEGRHFGFHVATTMLRYRSADVESVLLSDTRSDRRLQDIESMARSQGIKVIRLPKRELAEIAQGIKHQGVIVLSHIQNDETQKTPILDWLSDLPDARLIVALEGISDPRNLGASFRSANAAGVGGVILPRSRSCLITSTVSRTAAGAVETTSTYFAANLSRTIDALKAQDYFVVGLDETAEDSIFSIDMTGPSVLVFGTEESGLRFGTRKKCDQLARIPMYGKISSLNVSVAVGVAAFEVARQRLAVV